MPASATTPVEPITDLNTGPVSTVPREIVEIPEVDPIPQEIITTSSESANVAPQGDVQESDAQRKQKRRKHSKEMFYTPGERRPRAKVRKGF